MDVRQLIRPGIMASALVHLSMLGLLLLFSEVHPFGTVTAEPIAVELVTPDELATKPDEPKAQPQPQSSKEDAPQAQDTAMLTQPAAPSPASPPEPAPPQQAEPPQQAQPPQQAEPLQQDARPTRPEPHDAALQAHPAPPQAPLPPSQPQQPSYTPPEPDLTIKYGVMLGLPDPLPAASSSDDKPGDGIDANASSAADIATGVVAKFRAQLKSCAKLPPSVARSDKVFVKLRVLMTPQATLAAAPILIEGTASAKALELKRSAVRALEACQPYNMLPLDRYGEWKVIDLSFTPQDFA